jgi:hypothetical protein
MKEDNAWLHIALGTAAGVALYTLIITLVPQLNPAAIAQSLTQNNRPAGS